MDTSTFAISVLGVVNLGLACILVYYTLRGSHMLKGTFAQYLIAAGTLLFVLVSIYLPVQYFLSGQLLGTMSAPFGVFLLGVLSVMVGMAYSGILVRRAAGNLPWLEMLRKFRYGVLRLSGIAAVLLVVLPLWGLSSIVEIKPEIFAIAAQLSFMAFFTAFVTSERKLYRATQPSAVAAGAADEELLRMDIRLFRAYSDLTSRFSATAATITGVEFLRDALVYTSVKHEVLRGCEFTDRGFLRTEEAVKALAKMSEKRSLQKIPAAFAQLDSQLIGLYGAITSTEFARRVFRNIYKDVKEGYKSLEAFPEVVRGLPFGVLEDEKLAFARREELEQIVGERTAELERTITDLQHMELGLHESEKRFESLVGLLPEPVFEADKSGKLTFINLAGYGTFGYFPRDVEEGLELVQLLVPEDRDRAREDIEKVLREKSTASGEYTALRKDGRKFHVLMRVGPIIYAGQPVGLRGVFIDTTERKRFEEVQHLGLIDTLKRLQQARKVEQAGLAPERLRRIQAESVDLIKKQMEAKRPPPIVEIYKELLGKPLKKPKGPRVGVAKKPRRKKARK
jgi:PAS domain S-box-containing protein